MLIMENSEEVMQILERYTKLKQKDIPKELDEYLDYVARTGDTVYRWALVKYLFREKLQNVIKDFHDTTPSIDDLPQYPNVDPFNYETLKSGLLERFELFSAAPFTIQRLCELLTKPRKQYSRIDKFMRALEKNILVDFPSLVVSSIEPGRKQSDSENGDSLDSVVNEDISLDVYVDIDMENESIFHSNAEPPSTSANSDTTSHIESARATGPASVRSPPANDESVKQTEKTEAEEQPSVGKSKLSVDSNKSDKTEKFNKKSEEEKIEPQKSDSEISKSENTKIVQENISANVPGKNDEQKTEHLQSAEQNADASDTINQSTDADADKEADKETTSLQESSSDLETSNAKVSSESPVKMRENRTSEQSLDVKTTSDSDEAAKPSIDLVKVNDFAENSATSSSLNDSDKETHSHFSETNTKKLTEKMSVEKAAAIQRTLQAESEDTTVTFPSIVKRTQIAAPVETSVSATEPMDEIFTASTFSAASIVTTNPVTANILPSEEVAMHAEENSMATDPVDAITPIKHDEKADLTGMDVDDTSQEEAMDSQFFEGL